MTRIFTYCLSLKNDIGSQLLCKDPVVGLTMTGPKFWGVCDFWDYPPVKDFLPVLPSDRRFMDVMRCFGISM